MGLKMTHIYDTYTKMLFWYDFVHLLTTLKKKECDDIVVRGLLIVYFVRHEFTYFSIGKNPMIPYKGIVGFNILWKFVTLTQEKIKYQSLPSY